jgi:hypothetical protein
LPTAEQDFTTDRQQEIVMSRLLLAAAVAVGVMASAGVARADGHRFLPHSTSVTWPSVTPPGWYTDTYRYAWYFPWYAHYDYSHGPYANWMAGGGYAGYANHGSAGMAYSNRPAAQPYIGEWYYRIPEKEAYRAPPTELPGAYNSLQGMTGPAAPAGTPLAPPREMAAPKN